MSHKKSSLHKPKRNTEARVNELFDRRVKQRNAVPGFTTMRSKKIELKRKITERTLQRKLEIKKYGFAVKSRKSHRSQNG